MIKTNGSHIEDNNKAKNPNSKHYELWEDFEAIDVIKLVLTEEEYRGFLKGNILKYQLRLGKKDEVLKEIEKIEDYKRELKNENRSRIRKINQKRIWTKCKFGLV